MKAYEYLDEVCTQVKYKSIHKGIREELQSHIDELSEQYEDADLSVTNK